MPHVLHHLANCSQSHQPLQCETIQYTFVSCAWISQRISIPIISVCIIQSRLPNARDHLAEVVPIHLQLHQRHSVKQEILYKCKSLDNNAHVFKGIAHFSYYLFYCRIYFLILQFRFQKQKQKQNRVSYLELTPLIRWHDPARWKSQ